MSRNSRWFGSLVILLLVVLIVPILAACGGNDEEKTPTPVATTPAATAPVTTTPVKTTPAATTPAPTVSKEPIKIGVIYDLTGPGATFWPIQKEAAEVARDVIYAQGGGGLLGRPVEFINCDMKSVTSECTSCAKKLIEQDKVTSIIFGGYLPAHGFAVADVTDPAKVLYPVYHTPDPKFISDYKYTVLTKSLLEPRSDKIAKSIMNLLSPKTVGFLTTSDPGNREAVKLVKDRLENSGVKTVYEQYFLPDVKDFSPYLTRLKYDAPDVLVTWINYNSAAAIYKQIMELGGWGKTALYSGSSAAVISQLMSMPGLQGSYAYMEWIPGVQNPGAKTFEQAYLDNTGHLPDPIAVHAYVDAMIAMLAIGKAGTTDREKVALAAKTLDWESPMGRMTYNGNSYPDAGAYIGKIVDGKWVVVK
ncbi:MAG: ABC transporter substrate-binding protein [Dehalococcoidia bacterium]